MNLLFRVNKNHGIWLKNLSLPFLFFLFAAHPGLQPAVLACLAESTSLLLKAMNLKRQHVVGTTLGGSHTQTHTHTRERTHPPKWNHVFFSKNYRRLLREAIITVRVRIQQRSKRSADNNKKHFTRQIHSFNYCTLTLKSLSPSSNLVKLHAHSDNNVIPSCVTEFMMPHIINRCIV